MSGHLRRPETAARYPALAQFFACYFHQDWPTFHETPEAAVDSAIAGYPVESRLQMQRELADLLHRTRDDTRLRAVLCDGLAANLGFRRPAEARAFAEGIERKLLASTRGRNRNVIRIVAAIAINGRGETLLVRKRETEIFMLPGGKLDAGESALDALAREVDEELGCTLDRATCQLLGTYRAPAANEPGFTVQAELFAASLLGKPRPSGEIDALAWVDPDNEVPYPLAPLARRHAIPLARALKSNGRNPGP